MTQPLYSIDITARPIGTFFGGKRKNSHSVECPACTRPALLLKHAIKGGLDHYTYTHHLAFSLNAKNEPVCEYGAACEWTREHAAPRKARVA
jgi:hypothetical protein